MFLQRLSQAFGWFTKNNKNDSQNISRLSNILSRSDNENENNKNDSSLNNNNNILNNSEEKNKKTELEYEPNTINIYDNYEKKNTVEKTNALNKNIDNQNTIINNSKHRQPNNLKMNFKLDQPHRFDDKINIQQNSDNKITLVANINNNYFIQEKINIDMNTQAGNERDIKQNFIGLNFKQPQINIDANQNSNYYTIIPIEETYERQNNSDISHNSNVGRDDLLQEKYEQNQENICTQCGMSLYIWISNNVDKIKNLFR